MTPPTRSDTDRRTTSLAAWAAAVAAGAGLAWYCGHLSATLLLNVRLYHGMTPDEVGGVALVSAGIALTAGSLVGVSAGLLYGRALLWGLLVAAAGAVGGAAAPYAALAGADVLPAPVSASLAWAAIGLLTGLAAGLVRRAVPAPDDAEPPTRQPLPARGRTTYRITDPQLRERVRSLLLILPLLVASVGSLSAAALLATSDAAPGLLAAGAVGFCATGALLGQDRPRR
jgi:hypothetical protein